MNQFNTFRNRVILPIFTVFAAGLLAGCEPQTVRHEQPPVANNSAVTSNSEVGSARPPSAPANENIPVTMPLVDAMFADESFVPELKQAVQLTDDEIKKLRDAARNAVLKLGGDPEEDETRSTTASVRATQAEIEEIIGRDRTSQFFDLVRRRWSSGSAELDVSRPNEVPRDTRIVVNTPAYRMDVFKDGQLVKTYKIGIGYPEFPLPVGLRHAKEILFNPTWTPPDEPWVRGKFAPGRTVEAGSKLNPLGVIKIPIGLPSLIHGGKDAARLGTFASHGCVGLTNAMVQDLAVRLAALAGTPLTMEEVGDYAKKRTETKDLDLAQPVPVELRYETIVVENGNVIVYRDVYERGTNTERELRRVLEFYGMNFDSLAETERKALLSALEQMAVDAVGNAVSGDEPAKNDQTKAKVTRNVKGQKEVVVPVASLNGKGYPEPVDLMSK